MVLLVAVSAAAACVACQGQGEGAPALSGPAPAPTSPPVAQAPGRRPAPLAAARPQPQAPPGPDTQAAPQGLDAQRAALVALMERLRAQQPPDAQPTLTLSQDAPAAVDLSKTVKLPSGAEYIDVITGAGPEVGPRDLFAAHVATWLPDGQRLDRLGAKTNAPRVFAGVKSLPSPALREGFAGLRLGSRRLLILPPEAAPLRPRPLGAPAAPPPKSLTVVEVAVVGVAYVDPSLPKPALDAPAAVDPARLVTTPSGLQYMDLREGTGDAPRLGQTAVVHYTGWLTDGLKRFDSSVARDEPFSFPVGQGSVIAGWDEGVSTMRPGGKRLLIIPPHLGYSATAPTAPTTRPPLDSIPANAALTFEVTLYHVF